MLQIVLFNLIFAVAQPKQVAVQIRFISESEGGSVRMAWYTSESSFMEEAAGSASQKYVSDSMTITITVPNKPIAFTFYHDLNEDQELNTNVIGIPTEPYGFSMNARGRFGPPTYTECVFDPSTTQNLTIFLK